MLARGRGIPHALHIGIAFSSEELVASICPYHVLVHGELHVPPERSVLFRGHGEPGMEQSARGGRSASGTYAPGWRGRPAQPCSQIGTGAAGKPSGSH